jgi:hypothetical protein
LMPKQMPTTVPPAISTSLTWCFLEAPKANRDRPTCPRYTTDAQNS